MTAVHLLDISEYISKEAYGWRLSTTNKNIGLIIYSEIILFSFQENDYCLATDDYCIAIQDYRLAIKDNRLARRGGLRIIAWPPRTKGKTLRGNRSRSSRPL